MGNEQHPLSTATYCTVAVVVHQQGFSSARTGYTRHELQTRLRILKAKLYLFDLIRVFSGVSEHTQTQGDNMKVQHHGQFPTDSLQ